jgi:FixJ family two-component response regulator
MTSHLTPERITQLAEALLAGHTRKDTAKALNVSPRTVSRWKKNPSVLAEVDRLRERTPDTRAVDTLERLLDSVDEKVALKAAETLVRREMQRFAALTRR